MVEKKPLKKRDLYLRKLIAFQDTESVKVISGIRRCGKSSLLKLMQAHLAQEGVQPSQILEMNFESYKFRSMDEAGFYHYVQERIDPEVHTYLFFDEVQRVPGWENAVNAFRVDFDCDIYVTGSNAYMLSSEYATYLSGRCIEIRMLPLSFKEFLYFHGFTLEEKPDAFGNVKKLVVKDGQSYGVQEAFEAYMCFGGMPGIADIGLDQEKAMMLLEGIYSTVTVRDILERESRQNRHKVSNPTLLRKIVMFLADNIGSSVSVSSIGNILASEGLLAEGRKGKPSAATVQSYVNALLESYFFYDIKRFDIKGKKYLRTLGKYYIVDIGLRNYLLGFRDRDTGRMLENVVCFELLRRGFDVAIGKAGNSEIDFVASRPERKLYVQVTASMNNEAVRQRELAPLAAVKDNYEKIILSMDPGLETSYDGIQVINVVDWLLEDKQEI